MHMIPYSCHVIKTLASASRCEHVARGTMELRTRARHRQPTCRIPRLIYGHGGFGGNVNERTDRAAKTARWTAGDIFFLKKIKNNGDTHQ